VPCGARTFLTVPSVRRGRPTCLPLHDYTTRSFQLRVQITFASISVVFKKGCTNYLGKGETMVTAVIFAAFVGVGQAATHEAELIFPFEPFHNHGSSIVQTPEGDFLACWFHGTGERKADDVRIMGARKRKGDSRWSEPFLMADSQDLPDCNPVLFVDPRGTLWLFWIAVQNNEWGGSLLKYRTSTDYSHDGPPKWNWQDVIHCRPTRLEELFLKTVEEVEKKYAELLSQNEELRKEIDEVKVAATKKLSQRLGWMTRVHPIMTSDKRIMLGLYSDVFNCSLAAFTEDWGATWQFSEPILTVDLGNIQPAFLKKKDGTIVALMRDNGFPKRIRRAESHDNGVTWSDVVPMDIPNPGSSVDATVLQNGHWVLICNDTVQGRHILSAYLSEDEGTTWPYKKRLEDFPPEKGSGAYPSVIQASDGTIHCTYSYTNRETPGSCIKHAWFNEEWLKESGQ